jgi:hypothetical protein
VVRERWRGGGGGVVRERESRRGGGCKACFLENGLRKKQT